jgi:hypothetical protein
MTLGVLIGMSMTVMSENGGVRLDPAIPCSSIIARGPRLSAQQLHRSVHPLDTVARVARSQRAPL